MLQIIILSIITIISGVLLGYANYSAALTRSNALTYAVLRRSRS